MAASENALKEAFASLKTYTWGSPRTALKPIEEAVNAAHKDAAALKKLEAQLAAILKTNAPRAAKDYVCRKLSIIATAASVPALAGLLADKELSHMGRFALERMPCPEAIEAIRTALGKVDGILKAGMINSLGARRDAESVTAIAAVLGHADKQIVRSAVAALGAIGTPKAAAVLKEYQAKAPEKLQILAADAYLTCAERLLADGKKDAAIAVYTTLSSRDQPRRVRQAALRGLTGAREKK